MELSAITPIQYLDWSRVLPGRFCVAPIAMAHPEYLQFYAEESRTNGYKVILDNGTFESLEISVEEYLGVAETIQPHVIIAPDTIGGDTQENFVRACDFACQVLKALPETEVMYVPQCPKGQPKAFEATLQNLAQEGTLFQSVPPNLKYIGICKDALHNAYGEWTHTNDQELNRFYWVCHAQRTGLIAQLLERGYKFHFLGIGDHLHLLAHYWFVESMDTASLFLQSAHDQQAQNGVLTSHVRRPSDFFKRAWFMDVEPTFMLFKHNCAVAEHYAGMAKTIKNQIQGDRI